MGQKDNQMEMKVLCKWNGNLVATVKVEYLQRLSVCSRRFPFDPRVPCAFQPVKPVKPVKNFVERPCSTQSPKKSFQQS